jgi:O-antigen/teichoic acid export membrane protein
VVPLPFLTEKLLWLYSLSLIFTGLMRTLWHFVDAFGHFGSHAALWVAENGLKAVVGGGALLIWKDLRLMILGIVGAEVIALLVTWVWVAGKYGPITPVFQPRLWTDLVLQATPIALGSLLSVLYLRLDVILLEVLKGEEAVGVYSAASRLVEALTILPASLSLTAMPEFARQAKTGQGFTTIARKYVGVSLGVGVTLGILLFFCSTSLIVRIYGSRFTAAAGVLQILSLGTGFLFVLPVLSSLLVAWGQERLNSLFLLVGTLLCESLHLLLISRYGAMGAAWTVVVSEMALTLLYAGGLWTLRSKRSA